MINDKIDILIAEAMKSGDHNKLSVLRLIKNEFLKFKTAKAGNILDENVEINILLKMVAQREDSMKQFIEANRTELAVKEENENTIIKEFLPLIASDEEIEKCTYNVIQEYVASKTDLVKLSMKDMKPILLQVQETYPTANGKLVSKVLNKVINS